MQGYILSFTVQDNQGLISGDDGQRYTFSGAEWQGDALPIPSMRVDFQSEGEQALAIYLVPSSGVGVPGARKNKIAAGLLGILLGSLGIHKFYLNFTMPGVVLLLCGTIGWLLILPAITAMIIGLIEGIMYLTKSDEEFYNIYEVQRQQWF